MIPKDSESKTFYAPHGGFFPQREDGWRSSATCHLGLSSFAAYNNTDWIAVLCDHGPTIGQYQRDEEYLGSWRRSTGERCPLVVEEVADVKRSVVLRQMTIREVNLIRLGRTSVQIHDRCSEHVVHHDRCHSQIVAANPDFHAFIDFQAE